MNVYQCSSMAGVLSDCETGCECKELTESDIPGATLQKAPEKCKVSELRIWLQCRGQRVKTKETKAELCLRVNKCMELGDEYVFVDPYPDQPHLQRKQQNCGSCRTVPKETTQDPGPLSWSSDATLLPTKFSYLNIMEYSKGSGKHVKEEVEKSFNRGYSFFYEGYIHGVLSAVTESTIYLKSKCYRSMKKHEAPHSLQVSMSASGVVLAGKCSCVAGTGGYCNHIFALLYQVDHSVKMGQKEFGRRKTCTEIPAEWTKCRSDGIRAEPVMQTTVVKPSYGSASSGIRSSLYDARAGNAKNLMKIDESAKLLAAINPLIGLCQTVNTNTEDRQQTSIGFNVPTGSVLSSQLALTEGDFKVTANLAGYPVNVVGNSAKTVPAFPWQNFPEPETMDEALISGLKISITRQEANCIEHDTKDQADSSKWFEERAKRLTASKFGQILKRKKEKEAFVKDHMLKKKDLSNVPAIKYGREHEVNAVRAYSHYMRNAGQVTKVSKCGLVVNPNFPWLAASPDRVIYDQEKGFGLLEVKCPYSKRHITPKDACLDSSFYCELCEDTAFSLKPGHEYYAQVQGQMGICGASFCDFVVYTEKGLGVQRVLFDEKYWVEMVGKLRDFFVSFFAPVLLNTINT